MAFSVQGAGRPLYLVAAKWALRVVVFGSLLAGVFFPDWALVPFGVSDRSLFGFSTRLVGLATSPNYLGLAAATLLIVELTSASKARRLLSAAGLGVVASLAVAAYVMLWAQSRGVIIAAFVAALSLLLSRLLGQSNWAYVASSWLAVGSSALVVFWIPGDVFLNDSLDDSSSGRVDIWASVLSSWDQYRLFGVSQNSATLIQYGAGNAHNGLLELLVTGGMPLLSAALVLFISSSVIILRAGSAGALAGVVLVFVSWQFLFGTPLRLTSLNWNLLVVILLVGACSRASFTQLVSSRAVSTSC
nr:O-antigen ligase family protein [Dietzia sp. B44]